MITGEGPTRHIGSVYAGSVIAAGVAALALRAGESHADQPMLLAGLLVSAIVMATFKVHLPIARGEATLSMSYVTDFVTLILLGPFDAMLVAATGAAAQCLLLSRSRPTVFRTLFSAAVLIVTVHVTALAADAAGGLRVSSGPLETATATVVAATAFFVVNSLLVAIAVALARRGSVAATWHREFLWTAPACLVGAAVAVTMVQMAGVYLWAAALAAGPAYVTLRAYRVYTGRLEEHQRHVKEISDLHLASVEALARAIDARDQTIDHQGHDSHIRRVQMWATELARAAGLPADEIEAVKVAALLHDIGKLAVPEHILSKPGRLTAKEFARIRIHPIIGADILEAVPFPYPVASCVRSHHERWDGTGYPDGLVGPAIPRGARVLAVADYFDAVGSSRPHHAAASRPDAIEALRAEAGHALDPSLVALFLALLPSLDVGADDMPASGLRTAPSSQPPRVDGRAAEHVVSPPVSVFDNISRAALEMRALNDIARTLGTRLTVDDTMALLTSKLNRLVPGSCWVLFLYEEAVDELHGRFASGLGSEEIARMRIPAGSGASGWTARTRTALLNARAVADFEAAGVAMTEPPLQSALAYPLVDGDALIGVLTVYHVDDEPFGDLHQQLLDQISAQAASVLNNAVAFERLRDVSLTDLLTELPNMRALTASLESRLLDASSGRAANALLMIDVDDFKTVNDRYGHPVGDAALQAVARLIRAHVRDADLCARYAGDEFVVALSGCDRSEAERRSRELQAAVAAAVVDAGGDAGPVRLTISVGVAVFPDDGATVRALMKVADQRMYEDKGGRPRFSVQRDSPHSSSAPARSGLLH